MYQIILGANLHMSIKMLRQMYEKKIAIIGASYLQLPLIQKAKELGYETHVFAWKANDVGEKVADYFYPISIVEKERILKNAVKLEYVEYVV